MAAVTRLWLSALVGQPLHADGRDAGRIADGVLRLVEAGYPELAGLVAERAGQPVFVPIAHLSDLSPEGARTDLSPDEPRPFERRPQEVLLARDLVGRTLICTRSRLRPQLVRATDIALDDALAGADAATPGWHVAGVDVSGRTHALHWSRSRRHSDDHDARSFVDWSELEPLVAHVPTARRRVGLRTLRRMHPARIADLLEEASSEEGREILGALEADRALEADVVEELDQAHRLEAVRDRPDAEVAALLAEMAPDDAADLLAALDQERRAAVLGLVAPPEQAVIRGLLGYHPETAGGLMTTDLLVVPATESVGSALATVRTAPEVPDNVGGLYVVDDGGRLAGFLPLTRLIRSDPAVSLAELAEPDPPRVPVTADLVEVAVVMADYNLVSLAVVDADQRVVGIVTVDDVLARSIPAGWRRRAEALQRP